LFSVCILLSDGVLLQCDVRLVADVCVVKECVDCLELIRRWLETALDNEELITL